MHFRRRGPRPRRLRCAGSLCKRSPRGESEQDVALCSSRSLQRLHLCNQFGLMRNEFDTAAGLDKEENVALVDAKTLKHFARQYDAERVSDGGDLDGCHSATEESPGL